MIPSTRSMMKAARKNDRLVDMTFARSLDDFGLEVPAPEKRNEHPPELKEAQPQLQTGLGTQPGEPPMLTKYEDTAEGQKELQAKLDAAMKQYEKNVRKYQGKFYAEKIFTKARNRPVKFKTTKEALDWYNSINSDFDWAGMEARDAWARKHW